MNDQQELFPKPEQNPSQDMSIEDIANTIAANARPVEYDERVSDAALDQGWGPVNPLPVENQPSSKYPYEVPGRNRGRVNTYDQPMSYKDLTKGRTREEIEKDKAAFIAGLTDLRSANPDIFKK